MNAPSAFAHEVKLKVAASQIALGIGTAGGTDTSYVLLPRVKEHIQKNGRSEQRSDTWFKSGAMFTNTPPGAVDVDLRHARKLLLRMFRGVFHDLPHQFTPPMQEEAFAWLDRWLHR